jgi:hypothetical protein
MTESKSKSNKPAKVKLPKLTPIRRLFVQTWRDYARDWKQYLKIMAIVALPMNLFGIISLFAIDPLANSYAAFAAIVMNVAIISAIVMRHRTGKVPGLAQAYYEGTAPLVRFILSTVLLVIMLIPAAAGLALFALALSVADVTGVLGPEIFLIGLGCLVIASPSLYLFVRYGLAPIILLHDDIRPLAALRQSWDVTRRRYWAVTGRFVLMVLALVVVSIPATLAALALALASLGNIPTAFFNLTTTLVALPLTDIFLIALYRDLKAHAEPAATTTDTPEPAAS